MLLLGRRVFRIRTTFVPVSPASLLTSLALIAVELVWHQLLTLSYNSLRAVVEMYVCTLWLAQMRRRVQCLRTQTLSSSLPISSLSLPPTSTPPHPSSRQRLVRFNFIFSTKNSRGKSFYIKLGECHCTLFINIIFSRWQLAVGRLKVSTD